MDGAPVLPYCKKPSFNGFLPPQHNSVILELL